MRTVLLCFGLLTSILTSAQDVQWAHRVLGFSSAASYSSYSAKQILGEPNKLPAVGDAGTAWAPGDDSFKGDRYIKVGFKSPMHVTQIVIAETNQAGSVEKVYIYDRNQKEHLAYEEGQDNSYAVGRLLRIFIEQTPFKVYAVKVVMKDRPDWRKDQIDAIGISSSTQPWSPKINVTTRFTYPGEVTKLGSEVNTKYSEIYPRLTPDGERLYFCRKNHPDNVGNLANDDIWFADITEDGQWGEAQNIGWPLNNENHNYVCSVGDEGNLLTLGNGYTMDRKPLAGISQSIRSNGDWIEPLNLRVDGLSILNLNAEYYLSRDRKILILALESWDSYGDKDLYISFSKDEINFSQPRNMGPRVNSAGKEMAPFLAPDNRTIFFSSDGFPGFGNQDIFVVQRLDDEWKDFTEPENLGPKVNSTEWDSYFSYDQEHGIALLSSTRDHFANEDLYRIKMSAEEHLHDPQPQIQKLDPHTLAIETGLERSNVEAIPMAVSQPQGDPLLMYGSVYDQSNGEVVSASMKITPAASPRLLHEQSGSLPFRVQVNEGSSYIADIEAEGYFSERIPFLIKDLDGKGRVRQDFQLIPIQEGAVINLDNVYFEVNSAVLQSTSAETLDRWASILKSNPGVTIEIQGHTNNRCSPRYCVELSEKRARAVTQYLGEEGVQKRQLRFSGFGSEQPIANNNSKHGRSKNQRVELKIVKVDK